MDETRVILLIGVVLVVIYDFTNGFHDAADMIATAIAAMSMKPKIAIFLVTIFTFIGPFVCGVAVANTIGEFVTIGGISEQIAQSVTLAALLAAITYNLITWRLGLPSSSSTSLTSGLIGAGLIALGSHHINWGVADFSHGILSGFMKIVIGIFLSPIAGFVVGFLVFRLMKKLMLRLTIKSKGMLIASQYVSVSWLALSHGANDAQKGMGVLAMLLFASGIYPSFMVPIWVILLCATSITLGTLFGGWKIIKTVGFGIYKIKLIHSLTDQIGSAFIILSSSLIGAPVSTTEVVTTTLMGIGASDRPGHVRWAVATSIVIGWVLNIPFCMAMGAGYYVIFKKIFV